MRYFLLILFTVSAALGFCSDPNRAPYRADDPIVVYGEYPAVEELGEGRFKSDVKEEPAPLLIDYGEGGFEDKALREALHIMSGNVYGYTFLYKPRNLVLEHEEVFDIGLRGRVPVSSVSPVARGTMDGIYRVRVELVPTSSVRKWLEAFTTNRLRLEEAEGTSDFYMGWEGRSIAMREALRNLVLITARKKLDARPLMVRGDILLKGTPEFAVGAGRYYCRVQGFVNILEIVTYD